LLSDLHFEFHADHGQEFVRGLDPRGVDVLILAGDITLMGVGFYEALSLFRRRFTCPILYVHGNHEFYKSDRATVVRATKDAIARLKGVFWLDCNMVTIKGRRFLGTPLWYQRKPVPQSILSTDEEWAHGIIRSWNPQTSGVHTYQFADFDAIENLDTWVYGENARALKFLVDNMQEGDVVITHMLPTKKSVAPQFVHSVSNAFFVCDMTPIILEKRPALVLHGHTHTSCDYTMGDTRVVCNPFGYQSAGQLNNDFDENLNIELTSV
jgi:predicted phosphodiesterase